MDDSCEYFLLYTLTKQIFIGSNRFFLVYNDRVLFLNKRLVETNRVRTLVYL